LARRIEVELLGDASQLQRTFLRASHSATGFHRDLNKATRGALAGSGIFHTLGRSLAFASGGFIAAASIGEVITGSIHAATDAAATQRQLAAQLKASGLSYKNYRGEIDETNLRLSALSGFTKDDLDKSFTTIERGTGNVGKALTYTALAADIARGRHVSLATASIAVGKAAAGSTTALRRLGIQLPKGATGMEAIAKATRLFHGQAAAGATAQQKFAAVLHDSEVIVGTALLPTLNRLLTQGTHWLSQMNESGRLQRDVAAASHVLGDVLSGVRAIVVPVAHAFRLFSRAVGGTNHAVETLGVTFAAWKIAGALGKVGTLTTAFRNLALAEEAATLTGKGGIPLSPVGIPNADLRSTALKDRTGGVATRFGKFGAFGASLAGAALAFSQQGEVMGGGPGGSIDVGHGLFVDPKTGHYVNKVGGKIIDLGPASAKNLAKIPSRFPKGGGLLAGFGDLLAGGAVAATTNPGAASAARRVSSLTGRFNLDELKLANAQRANQTKLQRSILADELGITLKLMDQAKTLKARTQLAQQAASVQGQIDGIDQQAASDAAAQVQKRKDRADKLKAIHEKASQFAVPLPLQLAQAKADALASATGGSALTKGQISAAKALRASAFKAIRSHRLSIQGLIDAWTQVGSINQQLDSQTSKGLLATYHHASTKAITEGLNLTRAQTVAIRERAAQRDAHRGYVPSGPAALGQVVINGPVHVHKPIGDFDQLYSHLEKVGKRRGQRRGTR
jgi:hypothetical protein